MTLDPAEFIRRFLLHVLPSGFHRIRHYGLFAGTGRAHNIERIRQLLAAPKLSPRGAQAEAESETETPSPARRCPCCGRPDGHHRDVRGRPRRAVFIAEPDQDRHLMIDVALPSAAQRRFFPPKAARRNRKPLPAQDRQSLSKRGACPRRSQNPAQKSSSSSLPPRSIPPSAPELPRALRPPAQNLHRSGPPNQPQLPAVSSLGGFRTPAPEAARPSRKGPASETLHLARPSRKGPASETLHLCSPSRLVP